MKKKFFLALALSLCINSVVSQAALVGPIRESTKILNETFEKYTNAPEWYIEGEVSLFIENDANKCLRITSSEKSAFAAKTFRKTDENFVLEFKFKTENYSDVDLILYSEDYYKSPFLSIGKDGYIKFGEVVISDYQLNQYNQITAIMSLGTKRACVIVNGNKFDINIPNEIKSIAGIAFSAESVSDICFDDVRCYNGSEIIDEYYLFNETEKIYSILSEKVAVFQDCEFALNGKKTELINKNDDRVKTRLVGNTMFVPLRFIAENLGAKVEWQAPNIHITKENMDVIFTIGKKEAIVNGDAKKLDEAPFISYQTTLIPLRAFSEAMGYKVFWHNSGLAIVGHDDMNFIEPEKQQEQISKINSILTNDVFYLDREGKMMRVTENLNKTERSKYTAVTAWADTSDENIPLNLIDNNLSTRWSGLGENVSAYLDYGYEIEVKQLAIAWANGNMRQEYFEIYSSIDGENWNLEIPRRSSSGLSNKYELFDCDFNARYIRYKGFGNSASEWNSPSDIVALGGKNNEVN